MMTVVVVMAVMWWVAVKVACSTEQRIGSASCSGVASQLLQSLMILIFDQELQLLQSIKILIFDQELHPFLDQQLAKL